VTSRRAHAAFLWRPPVGVLVHPKTHFPPLKKHFKRQFSPSVLSKSYRWGSGALGMDMHYKAVAFRFFFHIFTFFFWVVCWKIGELKIDFGCHASRKMRKIRSEADESSACICVAFVGGWLGCRFAAGVCLVFWGCVRDTKSCSWVLMARKYV